MLTLTEALAQLTNDKSVLGWRPRELLIRTKGNKAFLTVKWDFPEGWNYSSTQDDIENIYRPKGVSDREWFGPPQDNVVVARPIEADMSRAKLLLGADCVAKEHKAEEGIIYRLLRRED
jgi:hypothetical protein